MACLKAIKTVIITLSRKRNKNKPTAL